MSKVFPPAPLFPALVHDEAVTPHEIALRKKLKGAHDWPGAILLACAALILAMPAAAQSPVQAPAPLPSNPDRDEPLEITADGTLEWHRNEQIFIAKDNALARQGDVSVSAAALTAHYRDGAAGRDMDIWRVTAETGVVLRSRNSAAYGDSAVYTLDDGFAVMTGDALRMVSPDQEVTAEDRFEYWVSEGRLIARGKARATRAGDTLEADTITAVLKDNAEGQRVVDTLQAEGHVVITTPEETVTGARGLYRAGPNKAELSGGVTIRRGPNILEGQRAEVDLNTNTSRLFGAADGAGSDGRVRGVFYPGSEKNPESGNGQ